MTCYVLSRTCAHSLTHWLHDDDIDDYNDEDADEVEDVHEVK